MHRSWAICVWKRLKFFLLSPFILLILIIWLWLFRVPEIHITVPVYESLNPQLPDILVTSLYQQNNGNKFFSLNIVFFFFKNVSSYSYISQKIRVLANFFFLAYKFMFDRKNLMNTTKTILTSMVIKGYCF